MGAEDLKFFVQEGSVKITSLVPANVFPPDEFNRILASGGRGLIPVAYFDDKRPKRRRRERIRFTSPGTIRNRRAS